MPNPASKAEELILVDARKRAVAELTDESFCELERCGERGSGKGGVGWVGDMLSVLIGKELGELVPGAAADEAFLVGMAVVVVESEVGRKELGSGRGGAEE